MKEHKEESSIQIKKKCSVIVHNKLPDRVFGIEFPGQKSTKCNDAVKRSIYFTQGRRERKINGKIPV